MFFPVPSYHCCEWARLGCLGWERAEATDTSCRQFSGCQAELNQEWTCGVSGEGRGYEHKSASLGTPESGRGRLRVAQSPPREEVGVGRRAPSHCHSPQAAVSTLAGGGAPRLTQNDPPPPRRAGALSRPRLPPRPSESLSISGPRSLPRTASSPGLWAHTQDPSVSRDSQVGCRVYSPLWTGPLASTTCG